MSSTSSSALRADPKKTSDIQQSISAWPKSSPAYFADVQKKVKAIVDSGQLSLFSQRLLGASGLQAAAGGQPAGRRPLPGGASTGSRRSPRSTPSSAARTPTPISSSAASRCPSTWTATRPSTPRSSRSSPIPSRSSTISSTWSTSPTSWPSRPTTSITRGSARGWATS
ncbi:MAG: nickel-dependent hydrogenase large subunit [Candidatus Moduliflexus flocculans]|nr:nickel-dependent hydrogenase large subunit [Candidatus Moduliflexus flocculans]